MTDRALPLTVAAEKVAVPVKVGLAEKTAFPVPVEVVSAASRLVDDGVARKVATPEPNPEIPVLIGNPVAFVRVPDEGVPSAPPEYRSVALKPGKVIVVASVPAKVIVLLIVAILPDAVLTAAY